MKVGWIGAGRMGSPMALRAAQAGHQVSLYAREIHDEAALRDAGVTVCASVGEAVAEADLVCACLFSDDQTREVLLGADRALGRLREGSILAIHTSGSAMFARELAAVAPRVKVLDAPFSGQAVGELTLLVGGDPAAFETARPVFTTYAASVQRVGELGSGQSLKLVNQFLLRANVAAAAEALRLLEDQGLPRAEIVPVLMGCSGASFALATLAQGTPSAEQSRSFQPYLDAYLAAAARDELPIANLLRRGDPDPE